MNTQIMAQKWIEFCERNCARGNYMEFFEKIRIGYLVPKRYYHTFEGHIGGGLDDLEYAKDICQNPDLVFYAWNAHDVIQDPKAKDNEEKSAEFAYSLAVEMRLPASFAADSKKLVMSTKYTLLPESNDAKVIADIDLSIFGKPENEFNEYEQNIRREYFWVPDGKFREGRMAILKMFLDRPAIYLTDLFKERYEAQARVNLGRSISNLK